MIDPGRYAVAWVGGAVPARVRKPFEHLKLKLTRTRAGEIKPNDPTLRAVLVPFSRKPRDLATLRRRLKGLFPVVDHGVLLAVVTDPIDFAAPASIAAHVEREFGETPERIKTIALEPYDVAQACVDHSPGPAANANLELAGNVTDVSDEERILLRRAFQTTFSRLELYPEPGGKSEGTKVWRATAYLSDGRCCEPFIVKSGRRPAIREEYLTWRAFVANHVPFPFRPPIHEGHPIEGKTRSLLISMFVTRAQRFDHYVATIAGTPLVISSLFDGPLRAWRETRRPVVASLGRVYVEEQEAWTRHRRDDEKKGRPYLAVLPAPDRLSHAFESASAVDNDIPSPATLYEMLNSTKPFRYHECHGHGDLNTRNLFVRWNGLDVILIDFSHARRPGAVSRDPARLEISLAFDVRGADEQYITPELLHQLYDVPLLPHHLPSVADGRIQAIKQIRTHVAGEGVTDLEYKISIAAHLLRQARTAREGESTSDVLERKALAYRLAARLITSTL
jgi:hypothetical protein